MTNAYYRVTLSNQQRNLCLSFDYVECADLVRHRSGILSASLSVSLFRRNTTQRSNRDIEAVKHDEKSLCFFDKQDFRPLESHR